MSILTRKFQLRIKQKLIYLFFLYFIFSTDSFLVKTNVNRFFYTISSCIIGIMAIISFIYIIRTKNIFFIIFLSCLLVSMFIVEGFSGGCIYKCLLLLSGLGISKFIKWHDCKKIYIDIMFFIAIFSLVSLLFVQQIVNCNWIPMVENVNHFTYKDLFFSHVTIVPSYNSYVKIWRNYGPFWEPGVYQMYLLLALICVIFEKNPSKIKMLVFIITILSTFSTAGYISLGLTLIAFFYQKGNSSQKKILVLFFCFSLIFVLFNNTVWDIVFSKLNLNKSTNTTFESLNSRMLSLFGGLSITIKNPLGVGPYGVLKQMEEHYNFSDFTNGFLQHFLIFGWFFGTWYTYRLFCFARHIEKQNKKVTLLLFFIIVMELCNEPIFYSLPFSTIIFYGGNLNTNVFGYRFDKRKAIYEDSFRV